MTKHEVTSCPRCESRFECRANSLSRCACMDVDLSREALSFLSRRYEGCLCVECLKEIRDQGCDDGAGGGSPRSFGSVS